jgi:hypothetical protein
LKAMPSTIPAKTTISKTRPITPFTMVQIECCCCVHVVARWLCVLGEMCSEAQHLFIYLARSIAEYLFVSAFARADQTNRDIPPALTENCFKKDVTQPKPSSTSFERTTSS